MIGKKVNIDQQKLLNEQLRQERETFEQRKCHEKLWFKLRLFIGYTSILMMVLIFILSFYILLNDTQFTQTIVYLAGVAIFVDFIALTATVWKMVLNPKFITELHPITKKVVK
jgi:hypothetical protein